MVVEVPLTMPCAGGKARSVTIGPVRQRSRFGWLGLALLAPVVAFQGVTVVVAGLVDAPPMQMSTIELHQDLGLDPNRQPADGSDRLPVVVLPPRAPSVPDETGADEPEPPTAVVLATPPATRPIAPAPAPAPDAVSPQPAPPPTPDTTRVYSLTGGSLALDFAPSGVTVVWATPKSGYEVRINEVAGDGVKATFKSKDHVSTVRAWWDDGPADRVTEKGDGEPTDDPATDRRAAGR